MSDKLAVCRLCKRRKERGRKRDTEFICDGVEIPCVGQAPTPTASNFEIFEYWTDIFSQRKSVFEGFEPLDYSGIAQIMKFVGVDVNENLYRRMKYLEDKLREYTLKESKKDGS